MGDIWLCRVAGISGEFHESKRLICIKCVGVGREPLRYFIFPLRLNQKRIQLFKVCCHLLAKLVLQPNHKQLQQKVTQPCKQDMVTQNIVTHTLGKRWHATC